MRVTMPTRASQALIMLWMLCMHATGYAQQKTVTCSSAWPQWQAFVTEFVQADGRVVDANTSNKQSMSEGQAYAMVFALIANDQVRFAQLWEWTLNNLAEQRLQDTLPAWLWGEDKDGVWRVLDSNSAADADVWMVYALLEAARLWKTPQYRDAALQLLRMIRAREVAELPGLGPILMPAPAGFRKIGSYRLNPSYWPLPVLRRLDAEDPSGPWAAIAKTAVTLMKRISPVGLIPDWMLYQRDKQGGFNLGYDSATGAIGSYDAIRVYLWTGMTPTQEPLLPELVKATAGIKPWLLAGQVPERVDVSNAQKNGLAPVGFYAAVMPYLQRFAPQVNLKHWHNDVKAQQQLAWNEAKQAHKQPNYYDQVLALFGQGWIEQRYQFLPDGKIQTRWEKECLISGSH